MAALAPAFMERWFTKDFRESHPQVIERMIAAFAATPVEGFVGCCAAGRDMDHRELLGRIKAPTLVIAGRQDLATPLAANEQICAQIPGASITVLDTSHISNLGQPQAFTKAVLDFLLPH
jgi:3-oxoadipate enol-lactonase